MSNQSFVELEELSDTCVQKRYRIVRQLGSGSYGRVYHVQSLRNAQKVYAVKYLLKKDYKKEKGFLTLLRHRNVIRCYRFRSETHMDTDRNLLKIGFMFMEKCRTDLRKFMRQNPNCSFETCRSFMLQIGQGLAYIHSQQIIHRDLKPDNILIDYENRIKISDFGLAKHYRNDPAQKMSFRVGTLWYQAPEMFRNERYDFAIDLWSLGCIFGEIFTGRPLFHYETQVQQLRKIRKWCANTLRLTFWQKIRCFFGIGRFYRKPIIAKLYQTIPSLELADLLNGLLEVDVEQRFRIDEVLNHSFFTCNDDYDLLTRN